MAQPIQDPTVGVVLQGLFKLQGRVRPALEEFIIPTVQVADISQGARPATRRRAVAGIAQAAVAGQVFQARFEIPGGMIAVIRRINLSSTTGAMNIRFNFPGNAASIAALAGVSAKAFTDGRLLPGAPSGAQQPAGVLTFGTNAAALATTQAVFRLFATQELVIYPDWVVGTGHPQLVGFLEFESNTANAQVAGSVEWDEYPIV